MDDNGLEHKEVFGALISASLATMPLVQAVRGELERRLPQRQFSCFSTVAGQLNLDSPSQAVRHLQGDRSPKDWLIRFRASILGDVRLGLGAAHYHLERIARFEKRMVELCFANLPAGSPPDARTITTGVGGTEALDFEYQAFRFALRRTLDYVAVGVGAAFKVERPKFGALPKVIAGRDPADAAARVVAEAKTAQARLRDVLAKPSARDRIAHWQAVQGGSLNIIWSPGSIQVAFVGGGEELTPFRLGTDSTRGERHIITNHPLSEVLADQLARTEDAVFALIGAIGLTTDWTTPSTPPTT